MDSRNAIILAQVLLQEWLGIQMGDTGTGVI